jgi:arginase family enzyme
VLLHLPTRKPTGWSVAIREMVEEMELLQHPVHISFDIDSVDPSECPSTGTAVPDGLSVSNVIGLINQIKETGNLVSMDLVEFNPLIGNESDVEKTVQSIRRVMREIVC